MSEPLNTRRPNLDPGTFGGTPAARILAEKINASGNGVLAKKIYKAIESYTIALQELVKVNDPPRTMVMDLVFDSYVARVPRSELDGIGAYSYYRNVLMQRLREYKDMGAVVEILRDRDPDHAFVIRELKALQAKKGPAQDAGPF